jgi:crotonobetainyl-CoA:carnitine CoA-transferase CaiB-like acyl-CoA transferase
VADHAPGNRELQTVLRDIFRGRTTAEWVAFGDRHNTPIAPVNTPQTLADDPQFRHRLPFWPRDLLGAEQLPTPIKLLDEELPVPTKAPTVGQHTDEVLRDLLGYDDERVAALRRDGALG